MKWLAISRTRRGLELPKIEPSGKSKQARRTTKRLEKDQQRQQEHLHSLFTMVVILLLCRPFVQHELSPQLNKMPRRMTNALDAPPLDIGPVTAGRSSTEKRSEFPEDLLFKVDNKELFKVQSIDNLESFYEYQSGKANIYVKGRLKSSINFWQNIGASDFILNVTKDG